MYLKLTSGASLTQTRTITFADNTIKRVQIIENATTGGQSITVKWDLTASDQVTIANGQAKMVYFDGGGGSGKVVDVFANFSVGTINAGADTSTGLLAAMGYTATEG